MQDDEIESLFLILHNPELSELASLLSRDHFGKIPAMGVTELHLPIESWGEIEEGLNAETGFFIYPKMFHHYMPRQIQAELGGF